MNPALVIVFFFWCGGGDAFCDEGRVVHDSCTAAEAWLHAGLQPGQTLIVAACETTAGQNTQIAGDCGDCAAHAAGRAWPYAGKCRAKPGDRQHGHGEAVIPRAHHRLTQGSAP